MLPQKADKSLIRLRNSCGRYLLLTGLGSYSFLSSFSWSAETSFICAAGASLLLELLFEYTAEAAPQRQNSDVKYASQSVVEPFRSHSEKC